MTELQSFVQPIRTIAERLGFVNLIFNNNYEDRGIRGAREIAGPLDR
jgi:hypothetical protein